ALAPPLTVSLRPPRGQRPLSGRPEQEPNHREDSMESDRRPCSPADPHGHLVRLAVSPRELFRLALKELTEHAFRDAPPGPSTPLPRAIGGRLHDAYRRPLSPGPRPHLRKLLSLVVLLHLERVTVLALLLLARVTVQHEVELPHTGLGRSLLVGGGRRDRPGSLALGTGSRLDVDIEPYHLLRTRHPPAGRGERSDRGSGDDPRP